MAYPSASLRIFSSDSGWGIVGVSQPVANDQDRIGISHRVVASPVMPADTGKASARLVLRSRVKEVLCLHKSSMEGLAQGVTQVLEMEFQESELEKGNQRLSQEDLKFLNITKNGIYVQEDGHYISPFPMKDRTAKLPNNRMLATKRLAYLRNKLAKDERLHKGYIQAV